MAVKLPGAFPLFSLCLLSIVAYKGKRGTVEKNAQDIKDHASLLSSNFSLSSLLLLCCFLYFLLLPSHQSSDILGKLSLNVETTCLVPGKSLNAPASAILCLRGGKDLHLGM